MPGAPFSVQDDFRRVFAYAPLMFEGAPSPLKVVVRCKGCGENIPAIVGSLRVRERGGKGGYQTLASKPIIA